VESKGIQFCFELQPEPYFKDNLTNVQFAAMNEKERLVRMFIFSLIIDSKLYII